MGTLFQIFAFAVVLRIVYQAVRSMLKLDDPWHRALTLLGGLLAALGVAGFLGGGLFANGIFRVSSTLNWPAGRANHVISTTDGKRVVGLEYVGRVQVYSPAWRFLRGWQVDAKGGDFSVVDEGSNRLGVYTARSRTLFVYGQDGALLSSTPYREDFAEIPKGATINVPTSWFLWPFSSPFTCWALAVIGTALIELTKRLSPRKSAKTPAAA